MDYNELIKFASTLINDIDDKDEVYYRNIIGRSYYGVYHHAVAILEYKLKWSESPEKFGVHEKVISRLDNYPKPSYTPKQKDIEKIKNDITRLKKARGKADYRFQHSISKAETLFLHTLAEKIIENLNNL